MLEDNHPFKKQHRNSGKTRAELFIRCSVTAEEAFQDYCRLEAPRSVNKLYLLLKARGERVSYENLNKWAKKHRWRDLVRDADPAWKIDPKTLLGELVAEAKHMTPELLKGLQHRLVIQIANEIKTLAIQNTDELERAVKIVSDMAALHHHARGSAISVGGNGEVPAPSISDLRARMAERNNRK